jgi:hypothetical protein
MDTVKLLDHYRTAATKDPLTFQLLAHVFHQGRCSEAEMASIGVPTAQVRQRLTVLFRSNLVRRDTESLWTTTELANLLLARAGLAESSIGWFIDAWGVPKNERVFVKSCLWSREEDDPQVILQQQSLIRSLWQVRARVTESEARTGDLQRALYAALIGLDARAESLGHRVYCDNVISRTPGLKAPSDSARVRLYDLAKVALQDMRASNHVVIVGRKGAGKSALALTWSRLLSAASSGLADKGLGCLAPDSLSAAWENLNEWKPDLNEQSNHILVLLGRSIPDASHEAEDVSAFVNTRVCSASRAWSRSRELEVSDFRALLGSGGERLNALLARNRVRELSESLIDGTFDELRLTDRQELCGAIDVLAESFRSRLLGREDE